MRLFFRRLLRSLAVYEGYLHKNNDPKSKYIKMILKRRLCRRLILTIAVFTASFYLCILLFGDLKVPKVIHLTDLNRCPVCYGITVCPELYSNQVLLERTGWESLFNAKNVYHGFTMKNRQVVLKKLAHNSEFNNIDRTLCKEWGLSKDCKPMDLLNTSNIEERIIKEVMFDLTTPITEPKKGLIFCPYVNGFLDFIQPVMSKKTDGISYYRSSLVNIWTMLKLNPEPIILQVIQKSKGWPVPAFGGVCGRLELVANEGVSLSYPMQMEWLRKLEVARNILKAAMDFTFKHDRFRFYLLDWSIDNIVVNERNEVTFVDLEDVVVIDKHISPGNDLPNWYKRYSRDDPEPIYSFSIDSMCKHHLSDHNLWAACHVLVGDDLPFLYPMETFDDNLDTLLQICLKGTKDRFDTVRRLQHYLNDLIEGKSGNSVLGKPRR